MALTIQPQFRTNNYPATHKKSPAFGGANSPHVLAQMASKRLKVVREIDIPSIHTPPVTSEELAEMMAVAVRELPRILRTRFGENGGAVGARIANALKYAPERPLVSKAIAEEPIKAYEGLSLMGKNANPIEL